MPADTRCLNCGAQRPATSPAGLCPQCLLRLGQGADLSNSRGDSRTSYRTADGPTASVLDVLSATAGPLPRVTLHDTETADRSEPLERPQSSEMPDPSDRPARLQLFGEIARGGMGAVLRGRDPDLGREIAVKVILDGHRNKPEMVRRFVEEAQIGGQLQHPGVVPVYELGTFGDARPYFAMKLVKGQTFAALLAERTGLADGLPRLLAIFLQVAQTVAYAHARGVVHRDLKPSNVMVGSFGEVQVMDWGLAKVMHRGGTADDETAGKLPDHETVIATARSGSDTDRSLAGSVMGTPAYMAPEQARGEVDRLDERCDVFTLGSMLCEVLTGQPAFCGRGTVEIQRLAARGDTADALARLDGCGADAELIAIANDCLAREPKDRPRHAVAVAERMTAYLAGVQDRLRAAELARAAESARAEEAIGRARAERRARRFQVGLAASLLLLTTAGGLTLTYLLHQHQRRAARFDQILAETTALLTKARREPGEPGLWRDALAALERAEGQGPDDRAAALRAEIQAGLDAAERDARLRQALVDIRANQQDVGAEAADAAYAAAFRAAGLNLDALELTEFARRLRRRPEAVVIELAAFLDDWSAVRRGTRRSVAAWRRPLAAARLADPEPYRDRLRTVLLAEDRKPQAEALKVLAAAPEAADLPAPTAVLLGRTLADLGQAEAAVALLRRAAGRHPDDVWVNYQLAGALDLVRPSAREEAVRYYTAARALRPETAHELAHLLGRMGRSAEAEAVFRDLTKRRRDEARHLSCLGLYLQTIGRPADAAPLLERAVAAARAAIGPEPNDALAHNHLGRALGAQGKLDESAAAFRAAIRLKPDLAILRNNLGDTLSLQGKLSEAIAEYREAIRLQPDDASAHDKLGSALRDQGKRDEAAAAFRTAIRLKPDYALAHVNLGIASGEQGKLDEAAAAFRTAIRLKPDLAEAHYNLGRALTIQGESDEAVAAYRAAIRLKPDYAEAYCNLGDVLRSRGDYAGALAMLRRGHELGIRQPGWPYPSARWVAGAERMAGLAARLPALLKGEDCPKDLAERLILAQMCYDTKYHAAAARFWAEALAADTKLGDDRQAQIRYKAACAAALAAAGRGTDDPKPDDAARAKLRGQALDWLNAERAVWANALDSGDLQAGPVVRRTLEHWQADPDLAGVRDEGALTMLPEAERRAWRPLWADVEALLKRAERKTP
jgi:eukaryotic-like serine/threonine-protein kinase